MPNSIEHHIYLTRTSFDGNIEIDLAPFDSGQNKPLQGRYVLWVDDSGQNGTEGIERELHNLGVGLSIVGDALTAERKIKEKKPDLIISDIARGDNYNAGFEMAEKFRENGLFMRPYIFYAGDTGHGRIGRASKIGAVMITERSPLLDEIRILLTTNNTKF